VAFWTFWIDRDSLFLRIRVDGHRDVRLGYSLLSIMIWNLEILGSLPQDRVLILQEIKCLLAPKVGLISNSIGMETPWYSGDIYSPRHSQLSAWRSIPKPQEIHPTLEKQ